MMKTQSNHSPSQAVGVAPGDALRSDAINRFCEQNNLALLRTYDSHGHLQQAIEDVCLRKAVLVAETPSCIAHSMLDVVRLGRQLKDADAHLVILEPQISTLSTSPGAVFDLLDALAGLEYHRLADRLPYGYAVADDLEHIIPDPVEAEVIRRMVDWYHDDVALADISDRLNSEKIVPRRAKKWTANAVRNVIDHAATSRWECFDEADL